MTEFTWRAVLLGLAMTVVLGAANAYLGCARAKTIAATYPAAVIGMAIVRLWRDPFSKKTSPEPQAPSVNSVAAGAIFTLPAFYIARAWPSFAPGDAYWKSTLLMIVGGVLGVLFVSLVRRVLVEDRELPFPESVAAAEIHKAGQHGAEGARHLFWNIGFGGLVYLLGAFRLFAVDHDFFFRIGELGKSVLRLGPKVPHRL
jgi:putative OPT family oligopeptide transporter